MAMLAGTALFVIEHVLPRLERRERVLSVARMSMAWNIADLTANLDRCGIAYSDDVARQIASGNSLYTSQDFFELLRFTEYVDIDFDSREGCSLVHDLNEPLPPEHSNRYDLVIENGTLEHIFDIKTAIGNVAQAVAEGGVVCHISPLDAFNHGFYNFSINFFNDFYGANGFSEFQFFGVRYCRDWRANQNIVVQELPYTHEEFYFDPDTYRSEYNKLAIAFVGRKAVHSDRIATPIQAAYDGELGLASRLSRNAAE